MTVELELLDEELEKVASGLHGFISNRLGRYLDIYVDEHKLGYVLGSSATYEVKDKPPKREPDVSFVNLAKMPVLLDEVLPFAPDLAVEIVSQNDKAYEIERKVQYYQALGVGLIWVIYPVSQTVHVYRLEGGLTPRIINTNDEVSGEDVIPGFKLKVSRLFE